MKFQASVLNTDNSWPCWFPEHSNKKYHPKKNRKRRRRKRHTAAPDADPGCGLSQGAEWLQRGSHCRQGSGGRAEHVARQHCPDPHSTWLILSEHALLPDQRSWSHSVGDLQAACRSKHQLVWVCTSMCVCVCACSCFGKCVLVSTGNCSLSEMSITFLENDQQRKWHNSSYSLNKPLQNTLGHYNHCIMSYTWSEWRVLRIQHHQNWNSSSNDMSEWFTFSAYCLSPLTKTTSPSLNPEQPVHTSSWTGTPGNLLP